MVKMRDPPKAGNATVTLTTGDGTAAVVFANQGMSPEPDTNYEIFFSVATGALLTVTTVPIQIYATAKTVTGFTINFNSDVTEGSVIVSWYAVRGQDKF